MSKINTQTNKIPIMKKIMLAVDALSFQPEMLDFPAYIAALSRSRLTGVFMEDITPELSLRMDNPDAFAFMTLEEQEERGRSGLVPDPYDIAAIQEQVNASRND